MTPMNVNLAVQKRTRLVCATVSSSVPGAIRLIGASETSEQPFVIDASPEKASSTDDRVFGCI